MKILICVALFITVCKCDFISRPRNFSIELLYFTQLETEGHVVISPFGLWTLMTGVALGTSGESYNQLKRAFVLPEKQEVLINGYQRLSNIVLDTKTSDVSLTSKNFLFLDQTFTVYPSYKYTIEKGFGASVKVLQFADSISAARIANKHIQDSGTNVSNSLKSEDFADARMILTNVVNFKGLWRLPFNTSDTRVENFYNEKFEVIGKVNMMFMVAPLNFTNSHSLKAFVLELPYGENEKYSMLIMLPHPYVTVDTMYKNLANVTILDILKEIKSSYDEFGDTDVEVKLPRFKISTNLVMNKPLYSMGVIDIFEPGTADLSRMTKEDIFISSVVHKAQIEVTEAGTTATADSSAFGSDRMSNPNFFANRPFVYFLLEKSTATVIFSGIYSKPTIF